MRVVQAGVLVLAFVLSSCGSQDVDPIGSDTGLVGINAYQRDILADGVTQSEVERAVLDTVECVREQGFGAEAHFGRSRAGHLTFAIQYSASAAQVEKGDEGDEEYAACYGEYLSQVDDAWADVTSDPDLNDKFEAVFLDCLEEHGFDVDRSKPGETSELAYDTDPEQSDSCFDEAGKLYGEEIGIVLE